MTGAWQVVRLHQGAVTVCCTHRYEVIAGWCADWHNRQDPLAHVEYDIRRAPEEAPHA